MKTKDIRPTGNDLGVVPTLRGGAHNQPRTTMITDSNSFKIREHPAPLKTEEWDFSSLPPAELIPALIWETRREFEKVDEVAAKAQAWLDGTLSNRRPPMQRDRRKGKQPRYNSNSSEAEIARLRASSVFSAFIPHGEFVSLSRWNASRCQREYECWQASYIRPLVQTYRTPWLCLPESERQRLCAIYDNGRTANIVRIGSWLDALRYFKRHKPDRGLPLKFDFCEYSSVLLTIDWRYSRKRILSAIGKILSRCEPADMTRIDRWNRRGRKHRDLLVMLERLAVMRLLHHYTFSEISRLLPEAWSLYRSRRWYDDRRQALKDFRSLIGYRETERFFPKSWETKAQRTRKTSQLPWKQVSVSRAP